jgi:hypothetical protein
LANCHSEEIFPPYRWIQGSPRSCASALMRSACPWAAWCFHSFVYACGRPANSGRRHSGVPSASAGSTVQAVKSVEMPITRAGSTPASAIAAGTAVRSTSR